MASNNSVCLDSEMVESRYIEKNDFLIEILQSLGFKASLEDLNTVNYLSATLEKIAIQLVENIKNSPFSIRNHPDFDITEVDMPKDSAKKQLKPSQTEIGSETTNLNVYDLKGLKGMIDHEILSQRLLFKKLSDLDYFELAKDTSSNQLNLEECQTSINTSFEDSIKILHEINLKISQKIDIISCGFKNPAFSFVDNMIENKKIKKSSDAKIEFSGNFMLEESLFKFDVRKDAHALNQQSRRLIEEVRIHLNNEIKRYDEMRDIRNDQQQKLEVFLEKMF